MEAAMSEMPLAIFTTLSPIGAGAFIALCIAFYTTAFDGDTLKKIDRMTTIPYATVSVGFIASSFHLANPLNAINAFASIGTSPLSNELLAGAVFSTVALIYWIMGLTGGVSKIRKPFIAVVSILAVIFSLFVGMAYMIPTMPSWNTLWTPVQIVGFMLLGGAAQGLWILGLSKAHTTLAAGRGATGLSALAVIGALLGVGGLVASVWNIYPLESALASGVDAVAQSMPYIVIAVVSMIASAFATVNGVKNPDLRMLGLAAFILAFIGIFAARLAFYAMQISVGVFLMG